MEKKIKALFIGLGGVGQRHLRNLKELLGENVEIYALRVLKRTHVLGNSLEIIDGENLEEKYNISVITSKDEIAGVNPDIAFICNPSSLHMDILQVLIENKVDVFIEKPISNSMNGTDELAGLIDDNKCIVYVGYQNRFHPCIKKAKEYIKNDTLGQILSVQSEIGENVKTWHKYEDYRIMYACRKDLGGGVVLSQIHEFDYLVYLFGNPVKVYSVGGHKSDLEIDVEDVADSIITFGSDKNAFGAFVHQDYLQIPPSRKCKIIGKKGKIEFDLLNNTFSSYDCDGNVIEIRDFEFQRNDMFKEELKDFLNCVNERRTPELCFREGLRSLKIATGIIKSMEEAREICL